MGGLATRAEAPMLAGIAAASVQGVMAIGPRAGARVRRCGDPPEGVAAPTLGRCHAHQCASTTHDQPWSDMERRVKSALLLEHARSRNPQSPARRHSPPAVTDGRRTGTEGPPAMGPQALGVHRRADDPSHHRSRACREQEAAILQSAVAPRRDTPLRHHTSPGRNWIAGATRMLSRVT